MPRLWVGAAGTLFVAPVAPSFRRCHDPISIEEAAVEAPVELEEGRKMLWRS
jgi:hypothetical protein